MKKIEVIKAFRDKTTAEAINDQVLRNIGDVIECEDALADERIKGGFAKEAGKPSKSSKKEEKKEEE